MCRFREEPKDEVTADYDTDLDKMSTDEREMDLPLRRGINSLPCPALVGHLFPHRPHRPDGLKP